TRAPGDHREERALSAHVRRVGKTELFLQLVRVGVHLPARGAVDPRRDAEDLVESSDRPAHLLPRPVTVPRRHVVLPQDVVVTVDADLEARVADAAQDARAGASDVGAGEQRAGQERPEAVVLERRGAGNLPEEPGAEDPAEGAAGSILSERKEERRAGAVPLQGLLEPRHTLARPAVRVDVDLERELHARARLNRRRARASSRPLRGPSNR